MRILRNMRFVRPNGPKISGVLDHWVNRYRCVVRITGSSASTSLPPFAPRPLRRFITTMKALTSVRVSSSHRSPCLTHTAFQTIPSPTTLCAPAVALAPYPSARQVSHPGTHANLRLPADGSRLRHRIAGSPTTPGRNGFVILRTGRSPPVASHPASRRRSYSRLQAGEGLPGEDLHLSDYMRSQAHDSCFRRNDGT